MSNKSVINGRFAIVCTVIFCVLTVAIGSALASGAAIQARSPSLFTVVIDAGHGGIDGGVTGVNTGAVESELNLAVAKLLRDDFAAAGFRVVMTRTSSAGLYGTARRSLKKADMQNRRKIIEKADPCLVVSIHMNNYALPSRRGAQVFYRKGDGGSAAFAECVQGQLNAMEGAPRKCSALVGDYYVLNVSPCPAVLVECGFLSSPEDEALLVTDEYRRELAYTVFKGSVEYLSKTDAFLQKVH